MLIQHCLIKGLGARASKTLFEDTLKADPIRPVPSPNVSSAGGEFFSARRSAATVRRGCSVSDSTLKRCRHCAHTRAARLSVEFADQLACAAHPDLLRPGRDEIAVIATAIGATVPAAIDLLIGLGCPNQERAAGG